MKKIIFYSSLTLIMLFTGVFIYNNEAIKQSWGEKSGFELLDIKKEKVTLDINGIKEEYKSPIYLNENRYYIPLTEIVKKNAGTIKANRDIIKIKVFNREIDVNKDFWKYNGVEYPLKKSVKKHNKNFYISLVDFTNMFNMTSRWNFSDKTIKLYTIDEEYKTAMYKGNGEQSGAIRFEDIAIDGSGSKESSKYLETLRHMGRKLGYRGIPYYIAWIPRYINPEKNIDLDPSKIDSFPLAELVYTLDYLSFNKGYIGLHGYTHQRNETVSGIGSEFGKEYPSVEQLKFRVKRALEVAEYLDIDITFFEAPHYIITNKQNRELEKYFKYIFHNYDCEVALDMQNKIIKSDGGIESYYIPTPLYYVEDGDGSKMIKRIKDINKNCFAGLFYHPFIEMGNVEVKTRNDGYPFLEYKEISVLDKLIDALEEKNIKLINFNEI